MRNIFEHVLLKLELLIVTIENVVKVGGVLKLTVYLLSGGAVMAAMCLDIMTKT